MFYLKKPISYSRQNIDKSDIKSVSKTLKSNLLTQGPKVEEFEKAINKFCRSPYAVACNSATSALHIACMSIGLKKNDIIWTNPISFVASANCALYCGAKVDYIDIDLNTFNVTFENFKKKIENTKKKKLPKILILVDYGGFPCDLDKIRYLAKKKNIYIIQDSSHSFGAKYKNSKIGDCKYSDITVFSFHPVKVITTGEGGVATTRNKKLYKKMQLYRTHGITKNKRSFKKKNYNSWYFEQQILGYNYRMNDIEASLGISQLKRINLNLKERQKIAKKYHTKLHKKIIKIDVKKHVKSSYHLFPVLIDNEKLNFSRDELLIYLRKLKINCQLHYIPIFEHPFHKISTKKKIDLFPNTLKFYKSAISLPMYYGLKSKEQNFVINKINSKVENEYRNYYSQKRKPKIKK